MDFFEKLFKRNYWPRKWHSEKETGEFFPRFLFGVLERENVIAVKESHS